MNNSGLICGELKTTTLRDSSTKEMKTLNESICILFCERMSNFGISDKKRPKMGLFCSYMTKRDLKYLISLYLQGE